MLFLILGLILLIGMHLLPVAAPHTRDAFTARHGRMAWRILFSLTSLAGLVLVVWGFGETRSHPVFLWTPPLWTRHAAVLLNLVAVILVTAGYVPGNHLKKALAQPQYAGIKLWALAHLLANGRLGDVILFGAVLAWAVIAFAITRRRDRSLGVVHAPGTGSGTLFTVLAGAAAWALITFSLHRLVIGVPPI